MAVILFYISLVAIVTMLTLKYLGIPVVRHEVISNIVCKNDEKCHELVGASKEIASKIKFENFHKLTVVMASFVKREMIYLKRRFDSQQPKFFLKPQKINTSNKHSVSFFLKNVSDYKDSLRKDLSK